MFTALGLNAQYSTEEQFKDPSNPWIKTKEQLVIHPELLNIKSFSNQQYLYTNNIVVDGDNLSGSNNLDFIANNTKKFFDIENINTKYYDYYNIFLDQLALLNSGNNIEFALSGEDFDNQLKNNLYLKLDTDYPELDKSIFDLALLNNTHGSINTYQITNSGHIYFYKMNDGPEVDYIKINHCELDGTLLNSINFTEFKSSQTFIDALESSLFTYPVLYIVGDYIFCSYFAYDTFTAVDVYHWDKLHNTINYIKYMSLVLPRTELNDSFYITDDLSKILFYEYRDLTTNTLIYDMNDLYINSNYQTFPGIGKYLNPSNYLVWIANESEEKYYKLYKTANYGMPTTQIGEKLVPNVELFRGDYYYYNNKLYISDCILSTPLSELFEIPLPSTDYPSNIIKKIPENIINEIQIDVIYGRTYIDESPVVLDDGLNDIIVHKVPESWEYIDNKLYIEYKVSNIKSIRYKLKVYVPKNIYVVETNTIFTTYEIKGNI